MAERTSSRRDPPPPPRDDPAPPTLGSRRLDELRNTLQFDKRQLDAVLERSAKEFYEIADAVAYAISRRDEAKDKVKIIEAEVRENFRNAPLKEGEKKMTVDDLKAAVEVHPDVIKVNRDLRDMELELKRLQALEEAFRQRGYAINNMVKLETESFGTPDSHKGRYAASREGLKDNYRDDRR